MQHTRTMEIKMQQESSAVLSAKHRHHEQARLLAMGFTVAEVCAMVGASEAMVRLMIDDPTFRQLVARYERAERGAGSCVAFAIAA